MADQSPYAETYCPYCGADEPSWNGNHADPEWLDLFEKHDAEVARLKHQIHELERTQSEREAKAAVGGYEQGVRDIKKQFRAFISA